MRLHGQERPDQVAIVYGDREVTWRELDETSSQLANALVAAGIQANDRIARIEKNAPDYFQLVFAASKINAVLVDVNWRLAAPEMRQIVDDAGAKLLFVGAEFAPQLDKIESELVSVEKTILLGAADATHEAIDAWAAAQPTTDPGVEGTLDDVCLQLYTSGTTGLPKGVMLSNRNLFSFIDEVPKNWDFTPESVSHVVMPTFHIAGSGWGLVSLAMGSTMILDREVDPVAILKEVEAHGITHAIYVPAVLAFLQIVPNAHDHDLSTMQLVAYGASPITEEVLRERDGAVRHGQVRAGVRPHRDHRRRRAARRRSTTTPRTVPSCCARPASRTRGWSCAPSAATARTSGPARSARCGSRACR